MIKNRFSLIYTISNAKDKNWLYYQTFYSRYFRYYAMYSLILHNTDIKNIIQCNNRDMKCSYKMIIMIDRLSID